jgi:hypothetical protein
VGKQVQKPASAICLKLQKRMQPSDDVVSWLQLRLKQALATKSYTPTCLHAYPTCMVRPTRLVWNSKYVILIIITVEMSVGNSNRGLLIMGNTVSKCRGVHNKKKEEAKKKSQYSYKPYTLPPPQKNQKLHSK